ncbi:MAG: metallophosphoesterase [Lachnospiraceae bacterium]|nr:metallophosphoesterase [Lachnospiraceae bacterium]
MKILIISDSHRKNENIEEVLNKEKPIDFLIHCGDAEGSEYVIGAMAECPMEIVLGNNDFFSNLSKEREFQLGKYHIWLTHGHYYYVSMGVETIMEEARAKGVDVVIFGHTHKPLIEQRDGVIALNPGSISYPRQEGRRPSYIVINQDENDEFKIKIKYL